MSAEQQPYECPTCGHCREDWTSPSSRVDGAAGGKTQQTHHADYEYAAYRQWRLGFGPPYYAGDVDLVEWRPKGDKLVPVATLELTRVKGDAPLPDSYLQAIVNRYFKRDAQAQMALHVAEKLGVPAYLVAYRHDMSEFWGYDLAKNNNKWAHSDEPRYRAFIKGLGT